MILTHLYSNHPNEFPPIVFRPGLNVILAEIRERKNLDRDTHNLGKTTLASLIDFCMLKGKHKGFFLFKHPRMFDAFVFFLEIRLHDGSYLTIRRAVTGHSRIAFWFSEEPSSNRSALNENDWTHWNIPFERAKTLLDGRLDWRATSPWTYRKPLGYALRLQNDYTSVFQLDRFRGPQSYWKPFLAQLLGLDGDLVGKTYLLEAEITKAEDHVSVLTAELSGYTESRDFLEGVIQIRSDEASAMRTQLDSFSFSVPDQQVDKDLVGTVERSIAALNERRYFLRMSDQKIRDSLDSDLKFDVETIETTFTESQVYFGDQIKRDYTELVTFLKAISEERVGMLQEELESIRAELGEITPQLNALNERRVVALSILRETETFQKYKQLTKELLRHETALQLLTRRRGQLESLEELQKKVADGVRKREAVVEELRDELKNARKMSGIYQDIRKTFNTIIRDVLNSGAVLSSAVNTQGHLEFSAKLLDEVEQETSGDAGNTYRKLLCVAFDIAVFSTYLEVPYSHFVYHDGVFESLDDRKKLRLIVQIRKACDQGLQQIITLIDSDLPFDENGRKFKFSSEEVVRILHDQGSDGRLFRMESW